MFSGVETFEWERVSYFHFGGCTIYLKRASIIDGLLLVAMLLQSTKCMVACKVKLCTCTWILRGLSVLNYCDRAVTTPVTQIDLAT